MRRGPSPGRMYEVLGRCVRTLFFFALVVGRKVLLFASRACFIRKPLQLSTAGRMRGIC